MTVLNERLSKVWANETKKQRKTRGCSEGRKEPEENMASGQFRKMTTAFSIFFDMFCFQQFLVICKLPELKFSGFIVRKIAPRPLKRPDHNIEPTSLTTERQGEVWERNHQNHKVRQVSASNNMVSPVAFACGPRWDLKST